MTKAIYLQSQSVQTSNISSVKQVGFVALNFDNIKITVDAYIGLGMLAEPRENSLITVVTEKTVYEFTPDQLIRTIEFYCSQSTQGDNIVHYRNRNHAILPDLYKNRLKQAAKGLKI